MKTIASILVAAFCLVGGPVKAQTDSVVFATDNDNQPVKTACIDLKRAYYSFSVLPGRKQIALKYVTTREGKASHEGAYVMLDMASGQELWTAPASFTQSEFYQRQGKATENKQFLDKFQLTTVGLLAAVPDGKLRLLGDSGHVKWEEKFYPLYVDERHDVVIGYRSIMTGKLRGLRLSTGEELWTTSVLHQKNWGWDDFKLVSDSMLMVAADNIYFVNITNGHTIKYDAATGHVDTGAVLGQVLGGIAMGMAFGVFTANYYGAYVPYVGGNMISRTCSNIVQGDNRYYISDRDRIACFDATGQCLWATSFPDGEGALANLYLQGDTLYLKNYGVGLRGGINYKKTGQPFFATYDAKDGHALSFNALPALKKALGKMPAQILTDSLFTFQDMDSRLTPLCSDKDQSVMVTAKGRFLVVDRELKTVNSYSAGNYYRIYQRHGDYMLTGVNENGVHDFWIVNKQGEPRLHITRPVQCADLQGSMLYLLSENHLLMVDMSKL